MEHTLMPRTTELQIRLADLDEAKAVLSAAGELADAVEVYLSPYTRESLMGEETVMADALAALRASVPRYLA
jgi:hypothetical protein